MSVAVRPTKKSRTTLKTSKHGRTKLNDGKAIIKMSVCNTMGVPALLQFGEGRRLVIQKHLDNTNMLWETHTNTACWNLCEILWAYINMYRRVTNSYYIIVHCFTGLYQALPSAGPVLNYQIPMAFARSYSRSTLYKDFQPLGNLSWPRNTRQNAPLTTAKVQLILFSSASTFGRHCRFSYTSISSVFTFVWSWPSVDSYSLRMRVLFALYMCVTLAYTILMCEF